MRPSRLFRELRYALRYEASYLRAVSRGYLGDRSRWIYNYDAVGSLRWR